MRSTNRLTIAAGLFIAGLQLSAFQPVAWAGGEAAPAHVEPVAGSDVKRITLTEKAIERLDLKTDKVRAMPLTTQVAVASGTTDVGNTKRTVVPYAALIYDANGGTWVYTSPEPRTFIRHAVKVDYIEGDIAVLLDGPPPETKVATYGAAELFGEEAGIGGH